MVTQFFTDILIVKQSKISVILKWHKVPNASEGTTSLSQYKLLEKLRYNRLSHIIFDKIPIQVGFRPGRSCSDNALCHLYGKKSLMYRMTT